MYMFGYMYACECVWESVVLRWLLFFVFFFFFLPLSICLHFYFSLSHHFPGIIISFTGFFNCTRGELFHVIGEKMKFSRSSGAVGQTFGVQRNFS